ncbi:hypothetical protein GGR50DRAFT_678234 [Xylaria sp. CBS 124048]|nr:hypothetical protein GGR50DRAFT_678234 [Xylaria sp. CBS 124048]
MKRMNKTRSKSIGENILIKKKRRKKKREKPESERKIMHAHSTMYMPSSDCQGRICITTMYTMSPRDRRAIIGREDTRVGFLILSVHCPNCRISTASISSISSISPSVPSYLFILLYLFIYLFSFFLDLLWSRPETDPPEMVTGEGRTRRESRVE